MDSQSTICHVVRSLLLHPWRARREQLVSTLDAERALRPHKRKVPLLRAVAKREGIMAASAKGEPYIVDTVALKVRGDVSLHTGGWGWRNNVFSVFYWGVLRVQLRQTAWLRLELKPRD